MRLVKELQPETTFSLAIIAGGSLEWFEVIYVCILKTTVLHQRISVKDKIQIRVNLAGCLSFLEVRVEPKR